MAQQKAKRPSKKGTSTKSQKIGNKALLIAWLKKVGWLVALPVAIYLVFFTFYSWPWMANFSTHFFTDSGDGYQNVWNIWWVNKSVTELGQLPWYTDWLHHPYGTTLLGQTMNPFNGFVAILLLKFMSLGMAFNTMVVFSFVFGGLTMFWLCRYLTKNYIASLIGGFIWTFSSYHFAHAIGHMQLVSLEWIPLFILLWWKLLVTPRYRYAIGAAIVLLLVLLCDYYYFLYSVATAVAILVYLWHKKRLPPLTSKTAWLRWGAFLVASAVIVLPLPVALLLANSRDPLLGSHPANLFSTDVVTPFLDGGFWRFGWLTNWYWHFIKGYISETSIYLTVAVLVTVVIALVKRKKIHQDIMFWFGFGFAFGVFALGPHPMVLGHSIPFIPMPYLLLEKIIPGFELSGMPVRMMIMVIFASAIIAAMVLAKIKLDTRKGKVLLAVFCVALFIELWPSVLPNNPVTSPKYVEVLRDLPNGAVLDNAAVSQPMQLYDQTISNKPIALGYISRTPTSVDAKDTAFVLTVDQPEKLCSQYKLRYLTTPPSRPLPAGMFPILYQDEQAIIYDLKNSPDC